MSRGVWGRDKEAKRLLGFSREKVAWDSWLECGRPGWAQLSCDLEKGTKWKETSPGLVC